MGKQKQNKQQQQEQQQTDIHSLEAQNVPNKINPEPIPRHIIIKLTKAKDTERLLKSVGEISFLCTRETL